MEVHHHSSHHFPRNWKGRLGEFLMLFLAVFFGFVAENLRESYVEKERAHEYMASMVSDLQKDTLQLQEYIHVNRRFAKGIDSLLYYLKSFTPATSKQIYVHSRSVGASALFENETGTLAQLKNAGGLRLVKDTGCVNAIAAYDQFNEHLKKQGDAYYKSTLEILTLMEEILDFSQTVQEPAPTVYFVWNNPDRLRLFYNKCFIQKKIIENYCNTLALQKQLAVKAIDVISKKYHLAR